MRKARERIFQHIETRLGKTGTLIIGVRCKDGIVIGRLFGAAELNIPF